MQVAVIWLVIGAVVVGLIAFVPRKRSWGPITYRRRSFLGGPVTSRFVSFVLFAVLLILVVLAITH